MIKGGFHKVKRIFIKSGKDNIYLEIAYPDKISSNAIIIGHGLRSYFPGFLDSFAKRLREAGYITIKFHFVGTGKSSGLFEEKTTTAMLKNYRDVLNYVKAQKEIKGIGVVARSNVGALATVSGPDPRVKVYAILGAPAYYSLNMKKFTDSAKIKGKYFYHQSFKRPHTKGPGRLPLSYVSDLQKYDKVLLANIKKMNNVIFLQSKGDEAVYFSEGHFDYWKNNLPKPNKIVLIPGSTHSFKGHKKFVISESVKWFKRFLTN